MKKRIQAGGQINMDEYNGYECKSACEAETNSLGDDCFAYCTQDYSQCYDGYPTKKWDTQKCNKIVCNGASCNPQKNVYKYELVVKYTTDGTKYLTAKFSVEWNFPPTITLATMLDNYVDVQANMYQDIRPVSQTEHPSLNTIGHYRFTQLCKNDNNTALDGCADDGSVISPNVFKITSNFVAVGGRGGGGSNKRAKGKWTRTTRKARVKIVGSSSFATKTVYRNTATGELRVRKMVARPDGTKRASYAKF
jgi:hypothetical protein